MQKNKDSSKLLEHGKQEAGIEKAFDDVPDEDWKIKYENLEMEIEHIRSHARDLADVVGDMQSKLRESQEEIQLLKRENKTLLGKCYNCFASKIVKCFPWIFLSSEKYFLPNQYFTNFVFY